jgi:DNA-binding LacI/PurR family transcriptional regulator
VSQPLRDLGVRATQRLLARIEDRALPAETSVLPTQVMIRASCGCQGRDTTQAGAETHR